MAFVAVIRLECQFSDRLPRKTRLRAAPNITLVVISCALAKYVVCYTMSTYEPHKYKDVVS